MVYDVAFIVDKGVEIWEMSVLDFFRYSNYRQHLYLIIIPAIAIHTLFIQENCHTAKSLFVTSDSTYDAAPIHLLTSIRKEGSSCDPSSSYSYFITYDIHHSYPIRSSPNNSYTT
jgi:hypothetical protein